MNSSNKAPLKAPSGDRVRGTSNQSAGERFLEKALKSVLSQSFRNWELIFLQFVELQ